MTDCHEPETTLNEAIAKAHPGQPIPYLHPAETSVSYVGAVIRFANDAPYLHINKAHAAVGVRGVSIASDGYLHIDHLTTGPVVSTVAAPDETLVARGISAGISGGAGGGTKVRFAKEGVGTLDLSRSKDYALLAGVYSNLWFTCVNLAGASAALWRSEHP